MNNLSVIQSCFRHNDWANEQVLTAARDVSAAQLDQCFDMGSGALRGTLNHILDAEEVWLLRWKETPEIPWPEDDPAITVADIARRLSTMQHERDTFLTSVRDEDLQRVLNYRDSKGNRYGAALGDMLIHVCNHSTHHRAQAVNMLRRLGVTPPEVGYMYWARKLIPQ